MTCERIADLLDAFLDGETDALTARTVEEHLTQCPACSRRLAARRALQESLRQKLPAFPVPDTLRVAAEKIAATPRMAEFPASSAPASAPRPPRWLLAVAASLLLVLGLAVGLTLRSPRADAQAALAMAIETDHLRSLQEGHLLDVISTDQHTVKPWFAGRVAFSPSLPDLPGYLLRGGRLDWIADNGQTQQAVALIYMRDKHTINLFIWPGNAGLSTTPVARTSPAGHHLIFWTDGILNFAAISDLEASQLAAFASAYRAAAK